MMTKEQMMQDAQTLQQIFMRLRIATEQTADKKDRDNETRARIMAAATYHVGAAFEQLEKAAQGKYVADFGHHAEHGNDVFESAAMDRTFLQAKADRQNRGG
jgi:hypothetical protein